MIILVAGSYKGQNCQTVKIQNWNLSLFTGVYFDRGNKNPATANAAW